MKAPVGLLSGRAVCVSRWRGFAPTSSAGRSKRIFTEKAAEINDISRHDPSCEKKVQESPQTFLKPEIINNSSAIDVQSEAEHIKNRFTVRFVWTSP